MAPIKTMIFFFFGILLLSLIFKFTWSYLVVRLFPGAVEQNLIAKDISWKESIILAIIFLALK